jgi:hypothetical protein
LQVVENIDKKGIPNSILKKKRGIPKDDVRDHPYI